MLNNSICINTSGDVDSNLSKACRTSEVPSLDLAGYISIVNGNSLTIATTDQAISVPSTGPSFQAYSEKNKP